jgi:type II secretory pathway component GspD/PulD (secretin)
MTMRGTQRGWWGRISAMAAVAVALGGTVVAQESGNGARGARQPAATQPPATQPATTQEAEAWKQLLELEAQFKREEDAKKQAQEAAQREAAARAAAAAAARGATPETEPGAETQPGADVDPEGMLEREAEGQSPSQLDPNVEELRQRAEEARERLEQQQAAMRDVPPDFVGPPLGLANDPSVGASGLEPGARVETPDVEIPTDEPQPVVEPGLGGTAGGGVEEVPADGRDTWFTFDHTPWEEVIRIFAAKIGKPLLGFDDLIIGGELTYENPRSFTKDEAIDELNLLMQDKGYRFVEQEHHIRVLPVSDMPMNVPLDKVYPSVAAFLDADPRDMDYVTVYYQVEDRSASQYVDMFQSALSDYVRIDPMPESNQIRITSIARDVRKFLYLKDLVDLTERDPRELRFFEIKTNAVDIEARVRSFMQLRARGTVRVQIDPRTRRPVPTPATDEADDVVIVADERTNSIIVKALPAKIEEIEKLIQELDRPPDIGKFETKVYEVKYADAAEVATLMNQIFQQEQGQAQAQSPNWQQQRQMEALRRIQAQQAAAAARARQQGRQPQPGQPQPAVVIPPTGVQPEDILVEGIFERARKTIRLVADSRRNSLIVYANEDGQERVRDLLDRLDKPKTDNFRTFVVEQANVSELAPLLSEIVSGMAQPGSRGAPTIVPDWSRGVLHVVAEPDQMEQIDSLIGQLDVASPELERYVVTLERLRPSQVAQMVQSLLSSGTPGRSAPATPRGRFPGRPMPMASASVGSGDNFQVIPLDEAGILIVLCTAADWEKIEQTITMWDERAVSSVPRLATYEVQRGNAATIAQTLGNFYRFFDHPVLGRSGVAIQAEGNRVMVHAVGPAQDEIAALIEALDVDDAADRIEILPLAHADATQVAQQVAAHFAQRAQRGTPGRGPIIQAEPVTNALIVQAEGADLEKIMDLAQRIDEEVGRASPERQFFDLKIADAREVANAVQALFGGGGGRGARRGGGGGQVTAVASNARVIVEAPREKLAEIGAFIAELDDPDGTGEIVIRTIKAPGADVTSIARRLQTAFREKRNMTAIFDPDASSETILLTCTRSALDEALRLIEESIDASRGVAPLVEFRQMQYAQATDAAEWLRDQLINYMQTQLGRGAAQLIKVTADARTNRVVINGPEVAVRYGMTLLDNFDVEPGGPLISIMQTDARKLPGLDVRALANYLTQLFRGDPPRPDRLVPTFQADEATEILLINAPKDMYERIDELVKQFESETLDQRLEQKFIPVQNAEVAYVADQIRAILSVRVAGTRGRQVVERIQIQPDTRQNQMVVTAPAFVIPMAEELVAQLDKVDTPRDRIKLIALENADATAVAGILQNLLRERIRQKRDLSIAAEPMTNSLIVNGDRSDFEEIERWSRELDAQAVVRVSEPVIYELLNADPSQVVAILTSTFAPRRGQANRLADMSFNVIGGQAIVVQAPEEELPKIAAMIERLDSAFVTQAGEPRVVDLRHADPTEVATVINQMYGASGRRRPGQGEQSLAQAAVSNGALVLSAPKKQFDQIMELIDELDRPGQGVQIKTFTLNTLNAVATQIAVSGFLRDAALNTRKGDLKPGAFAEPMTNTLVVLAPAATMPLVESLINDLEGKGPRRSDMRSYDLVNLRAEQVAPNVDQMLKAKVVEREGARQSTVQTGVFFHPGANRLVVFAPEEYQELAEQLIAMVDVDAASGDVTHIVSLELGDAATVAQALTQVMAQGPQGSSVRIAPVPAAGALVIRGLPRDVAEVEKMVAQLEGGMSNAPEFRAFEPRYVSPTQLRDTLEEIFPPMRGTADRVTVSTSEYDGRVFVNATRRLMREVQAVIETVDVSPYGESDDPMALPGGKIVQFVTLARGNASDIAWDTRQMFAPESAGGPSIEADWYGEYIIVKCRPEEFERIEAVIREFEKRTRYERKIVTVPRPSRDAAELIQFLRLRGENVDFQRLDAPPQIETIVEDIWPEGEYPPGHQGRNGDSRGSEREAAPAAAPARRDAAPAREQPRPEPEVSPAPEREPPANRRTRVGEVSDAAAGARVSLALSGQTADEVLAELEGRTARPADRPVRPAATRVPAPRADGGERDGVVRFVGYEVGTADSTEDADSAARGGGLAQARGQENEVSAPATAPVTVPAAPVVPPATVGAATQPSGPARVEREPVTIVEQPDGSLIVTGPRDSVEDVVDAINTITEDLASGEVIRIFRFRFGDVNAAAEILTMMFDVRQARVPMPVQQPQQQRQQQGQQGQQGRDDQQNLMEQMQRMFGAQQQAQQAGRGTATPMRIATDPSHNYLIIKCEASLLPEIRQLLRELDIPPGEVQIRVFQLRNLVAEEAAQGISDVLGISKVRQRRTQPAAGGQRTPQQQLVEMLQQQMVSVAGVEGGAKVERVEIVPNATTNSLLVSAPPEVMALVERVITELEALEGREVMGIYHHPLANAKVMDILPLLQEIFGGAAAAVGRGRGVSPAALGPVTISGDPRNNTVIFSAQAKDEEAVRRQIQAIDIAGNVAEAQLYVCQWGDAATIAAVLEPLYAARARGAAPGVAEVRIIAEPATNTILVYAPMDKLDEIFTKVEALDKLQRQAIRELDVVHANAEDVAAKLNAFFGDAAAAARPRGQRGVAGGGGGRIMIVGDKAAKKLLLRVPDEVYAQIVELLPTLDSPSQDLKLERYQLRFADATAVVESVKMAMQEYLQLARLTGQDTDFDAFTVMPDPRTNSVSVVGSERTFQFVGTVINSIDVPTPADQKPRFATYMLDDADAQVVAEAINALASGGGAGPGGRGAGRGAGGRDLQVTAVADPATNAVLVFGRQEDVDYVAQTVIEGYAGSIDGRIQVDSIPVHNVPPTQIVGFIWQFVQLPTTGATSGRGARPAAGPVDTTGPKIVPNDAQGVLIVQGTRRQIEDVRRLVEQFDSEQFQPELVRVIPLPRSHVAQTLGQEVERIITQAEQAQFASTGRPPRAITVGSDVYTNTLIVSCDPSLYPVVERLVQQLADVLPFAPQTTILYLDKISAEEAQRVIDELQSQRRGGTSGGSRPGAVRTGGGTTPTRPGAIRRGGNIQRGGGGRGDARPAPGARRTELVPGIEAPGWMEPVIAAVPMSHLFTGVMVQEDPATQQGPATRQGATTQPTGRVRLPVSGQDEAQALNEVVTGLSGVTGALKGDVTATALDGKRLVVTGDAEDIEFIKQILAMMEATRSPAIIEVFVLREAKAVALGPVIEQALQAMTSIRTDTPGPQDRFSINVEARSNSLIVAASEDVMDMIAELIDRLDVPRDEGLGTDFRTVTLEHTRASEAVAMLRPRIEELNRLRQVPPEAQASISAIDISNSVFIIGTPKDVQDIERMIRMVDVEIVDADDAQPFVTADVILVQVENAQATRIATVLTDMINEQQEAARAAITAQQPGASFVRTLRLRLPDGRELPALDLQRPIRIIAEEGTNSLIVFSTPKNNEALVEIVQRVRHAADRGGHRREA